jgi:hypothetical protein
MRHSFLTPKEASRLIKDGAVMVVAGAEDLLAELPRGNWSGGTTAYFMTDAGGTISMDRLLCSEIEHAVRSRTTVLAPDDLTRISADRFGSGFSYLLLPAFSVVHHRYALEGAGLPGLFDQPVMGWVTGVHLGELGKRAPKVFDGRTGIAYENAGLALRVELPPSLVPDVDIVNPFVQGAGAAIVFPETSFTASACVVDGQAMNFADYLSDNRIDMRLPLVANYAGAMINVSVQAIEADRGEVKLYAPVVAGETYRFAQPIADYAGAFTKGAGSQAKAGDTLACNCILNFLYAGLEGKPTTGFVGPVTFGEIAYILLNQTLVVLQYRRGFGTLSAGGAERVG